MALTSLKLDLDRAVWSRKWVSNLWIYNSICVLWVLYKLAEFLGFLTSAGFTMSDALMLRSLEEKESCLEFLS